MQVRQLKKARGFVLQELLVGLVVVAILAVIGIGIYNGMRADINATDQGNKTIEMVSAVQKHWRNAGNYGTVSAAGINQINLVKSPIRYDGTNLTDAWGNTMSVSGGTTSFSLTVGGATSAMDKEDCATIAARLAAIALNVRIGTAAAVGSGATAGQITGGNLYKNGTTYTQASLTTGCNEASPVIAAQFR